MKILDTVTAWYSSELFVPWSKGDDLVSYIDRRRLDRGRQVVR